jgi:hypothetical protein
MHDVALLQTFYQGFGVSDLRGKKPRFTAVFDKNQRKSHRVQE